MPRSSPDDPLPALTWIHRAEAQEELVRDVTMKVRRRRIRRLVATFGFCALAIASVTIWRVSAPALTPHAAPDPKIEVVAFTPQPAASAPIAPSPTTVKVSRPETRLLEDGSVVELDRDAEIAVEFTATLRCVTLARGVAHFQVVKDPNRPFVVRADKVETRAVGTAFTVHVDRGNVEVLVTEGIVQVSPLSAPVSVADTTTPAVVDAGNRCIIARGSQPRVEVVPPSQANALLAWRVPLIEFSRTPLHELIALLNQHSRSSGPVFEIVDFELRNIRLSGVLHADNTAGFEHLLETNFQVHIERTGATLRLHRRP
jgi:transmembrane sensor